MFDLELAIRALFLAALALFLTPTRALRLSPRAAQLCRRAALAAFALGAGLALVATADWFLKGGSPSATPFSRYIRP